MVKREGYQGHLGDLVGYWIKVMRVWFNKARGNIKVVMKLSIGLNEEASWYKHKQGQALTPRWMINHEVMDKNL